MIICDNVCQWLAVGWWLSPGTPISFTNKTDHHDIAEILLKVALNTITPSFLKYLVSRMLFIERKLWYPICCLLTYIVCVLLYWCLFGQVYSTLVFHVLLSRYCVEDNYGWLCPHLWYKLISTPINSEITQMFRYNVSLIDQKYKYIHTEQQTRNNSSITVCLSLNIILWLRINTVLVLYFNCILSNIIVRTMHIFEPH